jgi:hypothetical protein
MKTICPHCSQHIEADDEYAGTKVSCPTCQKEFTLPTRLSEFCPPVKGKVNAKGKYSLSFKNRWVAYLFALLIGGVLAAMILQVCGLNIFWKHYSANYKYLQAIQDFSEKSLTVPWPNVSELWASHKYKELSTEWAQLGSAHASFANGIRTVSTIGVDSELANNILKTADFYNALSQWDNSASIAALDADAYNEKYNSANAMVLGFLKGVAGYSLEKSIHEEQSDNTTINDQQRGLEGRKMSLNQIHQELDSDRTRIKLRLSNRDGNNYPHETF